MNIAFYWSTYFALFCFTTGMVCALFRMIEGPHAPDRILALDTLYINGMLVILTLGIRSGIYVYLDIAFLIALFGFVSTLATARFLLKGEVIET